MKNIITTLVAFFSFASISVWIFQKGYIYLKGTFYSKDSHPIIFYFWVVFFATLAAFSVARFFMIYYRDK